MSKFQVVDKESDETKARRKFNREFSKARFRGTSNSDFSKTDVKFKESCEKAGVEATPRQASKYRQKCGAAYNNRNNKVGENNE